MRIRDLIGVGLVILVPYALFIYLQTHPQLDPLYDMPHDHFYIVSTVSILATMIAIAVGVVGNRQRNIKVSFLALAYISLAETFAAHGLSTPGLMIHDPGFIAVFAQLSILLAVIWLWLSAMSSDSAITIWFSRFKNYLVPVWTLFLGIVYLIFILHPSWARFMPINSNPLRWVITVVIVALSVLAMYRYYQAYRYSRFPLQIAIVYSSSLFIVVQLIMIEGTVWRLSWWLYHFMLLGSTIIMIMGIYRQYAAKKSMAEGIRALFSNDPIENITDSISPSVKALIIATENKDTYTAGHNFRVTMYALKLAQELQLSPDQLRAISQGTIVHDVGKISIPDAILNKQGKLTDDERKIIETHSTKGFEMCRNLGFMQEELDIIRHHHEKWNGTGYPDHLAGESIPLLSRIVAIADVYDALTSSRAYRQAWDHGQTLQFLNDQKGIHFDARLVDVWVRACERNAGFYQYPAGYMNMTAPAPQI